MSDPLPPSSSANSSPGASAGSSEDQLREIARLQSDSGEWSRRYRILEQKNREANERIEELLRDVKMGHLPDHVQRLRDQISDLRSKLETSNRERESDKLRFDTETSQMRNSLADEKRRYVESLRSDANFERVEVYKRKLLQRDEDLTRLRHQMLASDEFRETVFSRSQGVEKKFAAYETELEQLRVKYSLQKKRADKMVRAQSTFLRKFRDQALKRIHSERDTYWSQQVNQLQAALVSQREASKSANDELSELRTRHKGLQKSYADEKRRIYTRFKEVHQKYQTSLDQLNGAKKALVSMKRNLSTLKKEKRQAELLASQRKKKLTQFQRIFDKTVGANLLEASPVQAPLLNGTVDNLRAPKRNLAHVKSSGYGLSGSNPNSPSRDGSPVSLLSSRARRRRKRRNRNRGKKLISRARSRDGLGSGFGPSTPGDQSSSTGVRSGLTPTPSGDDTDFDQISDAGSAGDSGMDESMDIDAMLEHLAMGGHGDS